MAISIYTDFKVYDEQFQTGFYDKITQMINAFNAASNNTITLSAEIVKGHAEKFAYFKRPAGLISRQDITSTSAATSLKVEQDEKNSIKVHRKIGPVDYTPNAAKLSGLTPEEVSFTLGQMIAEGVMQDKLNTAIRSIVGFLKGETSNLYSALGETTKTMLHKYLMEGRKKLGDSYSQIALWLFHSTPWHDLMQNALTDNIYNVSNISIIEGTTPTMNIPSLVTDSPDLVNEPASGVDQYYTLGLSQNAVNVKETQNMDMKIEVVTGLEQLVLRMQGEYAYNLKVKDAAFDTSKTNPTDAQLAASANWTSKAVDAKQLGSCVVLTN